MVGRSKAPQKDAAQKQQADERAFVISDEAEPGGILWSEENKMSTNLHEAVTARIVAELRTGTPPWVQPWSRTPGRNIARNAVSKRRYSGVNVLLLWGAMRAHGWTVPYFLTFKQALEAGGHVRKDEHGTHIIFYKDLVVKGEDDDERRIPMLKGYTVFNVAQCDNLPDRIADPPSAPVPPQHSDERDLLIDEFTATIGAYIHENPDQAAYSKQRDRILMPPFRAFQSAAVYYATLFHEVTHWTAAPSRLNRDLPPKHDKRGRAAEELIAELGAAFLCAEFGIDGAVPHATYIESWIQLLEDDPKAIFTAASKATKAVDYLRQLILAAPAAQAAE
jgi:antirestriction protein ArdC